MQARRRFLGRLGLGLAGRLSGADWPQFLGPGRDGRAPDDAGLIGEFADGEAKVLWTTSCGAGFAGPVMSGGAVLLFHREGELSVVESWDALTGKRRWKQTWGCSYRDDFGFDDGPRSSPTVADGVVYCYSADGVLTALNEKDGAMRWTRDMVSETGSEKGFFGRCSAPLVSGGLVLLSPGGKGAAAAAFDVKTGELRWKALDHEAGYASPVLLPGKGAERVVFFTREGVAVVDAMTGKAGRLQPFRARMEASVNAASPVVCGPGRFFTSACYDTGAALWEAGEGNELKAVWKEKERLDCHYATPVLCGDVLVGFHGRQEEGQELRAVAVADGAVRWAVPLAAGHVVVCGRRLVILTEKGELILAAMDGAKAPGLKERVSVVRGGHRAPPALAGGLLAVRDKSRLVCVDLRAGK